MKVRNLQVSLSIGIPLALLAPVAKAQAPSNELIPVNLTAAALAPATKNLLVTKVNALFAARVSYPTSNTVAARSFPSTAARNASILAELPNSDTFIYVLSEQEAVSAGFAVVSASANRNSSVVVQEYTLYKDVVSDQLTQRIGVGVRLIVNVNQSSVQIGTSSISAIAASAQSQKLKATVRLQVIGIQGAPITNAIPLPPELTFTTLTQLYTAMDTIKRAIYSTAGDNDPNVITITPQVIDVSKSALTAEHPN